MSQDTTDRLPPLSEQVAEQIGGWRGILESSIPVVVFVFVKIFWPLRTAIVVAVVAALLIAGLRLWQRKPIRYAVNGVFGVALGAVIAWRSGDARDFHLPAILYSLGYGLALLGSVALRQPLVGWIWSVVAAGGKSDWRGNPRLLRAFSWLTVGWAAVYLGKAAVQGALWQARMETALDVARIALGFPPYALLLAGTIWAASRILREQEAAGLPETGEKPASV